MRVTRLTERLGDLGSLEMLYVDRSDLTSLPASFGRLSKLWFFSARGVENGASLVAPHLASLRQDLQAHY